MSASIKKICIQCKIANVASGGNRKLYCDKCFITVNLSKKNKVHIMNPISEESENSHNTNDIKQIIKEVVKEVVSQQNITNQYVPHRIEDILPKIYLESIYNTQQERIKQLESENAYYKHLTQYVSYGYNHDYDNNYDNNGYYGCDGLYYGYNGYSVYNTT
jgi:hypothetical protein